MRGSYEVLHSIPRTHILKRKEKKRKEKKRKEKKRKEKKKAGMVMCL